MKRTTFICISVLLSGLLAMPALAQFTTTELHSPLLMTEGEFGAAVAGIGDINGDGVPDVAVGASEEQRAYVFNGADGTQILPTLIGGGDFGIAVAGAGDVNNDGIPDIIVGASSAIVDGLDAGQAYVFSGATGALLPTHILQSVSPKASGKFGISVAGVGDLDGDGHAEVAVGASAEDAGGQIFAGRVYVFDGATGLLYFASPLEAPVPQTFSDFGGSVSGAGDVNNDGTPDIIVGASTETDGSPTKAGKAYVFNGATGAVLPTHILRSVFPKFFGRFGTSVSGAGDLNGDGFAEVVVGASTEDVGGTPGAGRAYIFDGQTGTPITPHLTPPPSTSQERFGSSVASAGDVNNDATPDIIVGAPRYSSSTFMRMGRAYIFSGADRGLLHTLTSPTPQTDGRFGNSVSGTGDVNGDGKDDVIVGAFQEDFSGFFHTGKAYIFKTSPPSILSLIFSGLLNTAIVSPLCTVNLDALVCPGGFGPDAGLCLFVSNNCPAPAPLALAKTGVAAANPDDLFGVSIDLGEAEFSQVQFADFPVLPDNAFVTVTAIGTGDEIPGTTLASLITTGVDVGGLATVEFDFGPTGADLFQVDIFDGDQSVFSGQILDNPKFEMIGPMFDVALPFRLTTPDPNGPMQASASYTEVTEIHVPDGPTVFGDRIVVVAENPELDVTQVSGTEVTASGIPQFILAQEALGLFDFPHSGLGEAQLDALGGSLTISNIGSSGEDGVAIDLTDALPPGDNTLELLLDPLNLSEGTNPCFIVRGEGVIDGQPGAFGEVSLGGSNNQFDLTADFSGVGATQVRVEVFKEGLLVGIATAPNGIAGAVNPCFLVTDKVQVNRLSVVGQVDPCFIVGFENLMEFTDLQNNTLTGDELHLSPQDASANSLDEFSSLALKAANLDAFTLTGETPGFTQPPALFFELSHSALGQALFSDDGGKLVVSNIGSSGLDGVAIDVDDGVPPADNTLTVLLEPLTLGGSVNPDYLTWQGVGLIDGKSGVFGRVTLGGSNNVLDLEADFSGVGATQVQVEVFKEGQLVGTASAPNGVAGRVDPCFLVTDKVQVNRLSVVGIVAPCFIVGFENLMEFTDLQNNMLTGDELRLSPAAATGPPIDFAVAGKSPFEGGFRGMSTSAGVESFDTFTLQGAGLGQLTITDELLGLPQPSPEEVIDEVLTAIDALLADPDTPKKARKKLTAAKKKLISAKQKLAKGKMMSFFGRLKGAVAALEQAGDKSADVAGLIDDLVGIAARLAQETLAEARTYAGDPVVDRIIARAEASFAEAEARRAAGRFREAIQKYKETWKWAQRAISRGMPKQATEPEPVAVAAVPTEFELQQNYPNPFNPSTTITFALPQASEATLAIYNLRGQLLRTLHTGPLPAGVHRVVWDGTDFRGARAASGVYVYRLQAGERVLSRKLVLMK